MAVRKRVLISICVGLFVTVTLLTVVRCLCQSANAGLMSRDEYTDIERSITAELGLDTVEVKSVEAHLRSPSLWRKLCLAAARLGRSSSSSLHAAPFSEQRRYRNANHELTVVLSGIGDRIHHIQIPIDGGNEQLAEEWKLEFSSRAKARVEIVE